MGFTQKIIDLIKVNPDLQAQFQTYAAGGEMAYAICQSAENGKQSVILASMKMGAALYREWLISRGLNVEEVENKKDRMIP